MPKNKIFLLLLLFLTGVVILSSNVSADYVSFPNGSFETGDLTNWTVDFNNTHAGLGCTTATNDATTAVGNFTPTNGTQALKITNSTGNKNCYQIRNTSAYTFNGFYRFYADVNITTTSGNCATAVCKIQFYKNSVKDDTLCGPFQGPVGPAVVASGPEVCDFNGTNFTFETFLGTGSGGAWQGSTRLDNYKYKQVPVLTHNVAEESDPFPIDGNFSITDALYNSLNGAIVSDANCVINFNGTNAVMPFNSGIQKYEYTFSTSSAQTVSYTLGCTNTSFESYSGYTPFPNYYNPDSNVSGTVTFTTNLSTGNKLIVTDISNVTHQINDINVEFTPTSESNDIIYSIDNNYTSSLDIPQIFFNSLTDGRQYWVYTADQTQYSAGSWVFNDTLTFGSTTSTPVQKIWNGEEYVYSFTDTLLSGQLKYYKLSYLAPYKHYFSIKDNVDWLSIYQPNAIDANGIIADQFPVNTYSNIRSTYIEQIPDITQDEFNTAGYELQFTAWASVNATPLYTGFTNFSIETTQNTISLSTIPHRYSMEIDGNNFDSQILIKSNNQTFVNIFITDYAIVPRGYFTKRLELFKENGDPLDLFLLNFNSEKYLAEGQPFKISTQAYDVSGKLETLQIQSYFENNNSDVNQVSEKITDINSGTIENLFDFDQVQDPIIDLNGNAVIPSQPRNLTVKATLIDNDGVEFAEQSQIIKFAQFPYFGGDFQLEFFPTEKRKGKNPAGIVQINTLNMDALEALDIRIYDVNSSLEGPDYQKRIYKGTDFTCVSNNCSFSIKIDDFLFEDANLVHFVITGVMNTEYFSLTNPLIQVDRTIYLSQIAFDVAKIYQTIERTNADVHQANKYNNTEEIPLFLALRSGDKDNLKDQILVYLTLENCDKDTNFAGAGNCVSQTTKWYPTGYLYDDKFGYNVYYFRNIFLLDNGQLLPDGNYIGFHAHVSDPKGIINPIVPVLAPRCNNQGIVDLAFFPMAGLSALSNLLGFTNGCQLGQQSDVVTTTLNSNQEIRIHIVNSYTPAPPAFPGQFCIAPDTNNIVPDSLKQDLVCLVVYTVSEKPIDDFRFRLGNQFSDYSVTGSNKQYVEFNVPYELVSFNDPLLLKAELESKGSTITTVGDFYYEILKDFVINSALAFQLPQEADFILGNGLIPNIGGDINTTALNQAFSATTVSGVMLIDIKGAPIVNAQDFKYNSKISSTFDAIDRKSFLSYLQKKGVSYKTLVPAKLNVIVSDIAIPVNFYDTNGAILIDQVPTKDNINQNNLDSNKITPYGNKVPASIILTLSSTMFFNNYSQSYTLANILVIYAFFFQSITDFFNGLLGGLTNPDPSVDPFGAGINFLYSNLLFIIAGLGFIYVAAVVRDRYLGRRG